MLHSFGLGRVRLLTAVGIASGAIAVWSAGVAHAQTLATCSLQTHVTLAGGAFSSDGPGDASCTGVIDGVLVGAGGNFSAQGTYGGQPCSMSSWHGSFDAAVPRVISLFGDRYERLAGSLQLTELGQSGMLSGGGTVAGDRIGYTGTAWFRPDGGSACSGTLTESVVILDGGNADAAPAPNGSTHHAKHRHHRRNRRRR